MKKPICWTIAGSDSGGGAGIQADLATFHAFSVHGCSIISAITAQNSYQVSDVYYTPAESVQAQLTTLARDLATKVIKIGVLGSIENIKTVTSFLEHYAATVICDPVMVATCGDHLSEAQSTQAFIDLILPKVALLTPNCQEAEALTGLELNKHGVARVAQRLLSFGPKSVLLKNAGKNQDFCQDYWTDGQSSFWLNQSCQLQANTHGSGCTLSAAIAANLAKGYCLADALVIAKIYVTHGIRSAHQYGAGLGPVNHVVWPQSASNLPWLTETMDAVGSKRLKFPRCEPKNLGFYPILPSVAWLERLLPAKPKAVQLRIKDKQGLALEQAIQSASVLAREHQINLFINDYWELAIKYKAYGVHLGQDDLYTANCPAIAKAGLRLGISTHDFSELARAHALQPSYIALGPIFKTQSKPMSCQPQGIDRLKLWRQLVPFPLVAIGGIDLERLPIVRQTGVEGIAVIAAITQSSHPLKSAQAFMNALG